MYAAKAQEFTLSGKVGYYSTPAKAYLLYRLTVGETPKRDSATIKDGSFEFKGSIPYPINTWLIIKDGIPWTQVSDLKGWKNGVSQQYGIQGIPANFLVETSGTIIAKNLHGTALEKKLADVLQ